MKRRLLAIFATVSLLLCAATVVLWVRSYWRGDHLFFSKPVLVILYSERGRVWANLSGWSVESFKPDVSLEIAGFGYKGDNAFFRIIVPDWFLTLSFGQ